jgi:hypothetical protein
MRCEEVVVTYGASRAASNRRRKCLKLKELQELPERRMISRPSMEFKAEPAEKQCCTRSARENAVLKNSAGRTHERAE